MKSKLSARMITAGTKYAMNKLKRGPKPIAPEDRKIMVAMYLPPWIAKKLKETPGSQAKIVETALVNFYNWIKK